MTDFNSIIETQCILFLIGTEQTSFQVHAGAVSAVSPVLSAMIESGMKESVERTVTIKEVDAETFKLFVEYCYRNLYTLQPKRTTTASTSDSASLCYCFRCGKLICDREGTPYPYCSLECLYDLHVVEGGKSSYFCVTYGRRQHADVRQNRCQGCSEEEKECRQAGEQTFLNSARGRKECSPALETKFKALMFAVGELSHGHSRTAIRHGFINKEISDMVSMHARVFVFAETYLITELKQIALHILHHDLIELEITATTIEEVVELIRYTYDSTSRASPDCIGVGEDLRSLVVGYVAWRANWLSSYQSFNDLVADGGDFATDFTRALLEQL